MTPIDELVPDPVQHAAPRAPMSRGRVVAPLPTLGSEPLYVRLRGYAASLPTTIPGGQWFVPHEFPVLGMDVLVMFDDHGDAHALAGFDTYPISIDPAHRSSDAAGEEGTTHATPLTWKTVAAEDADRVEIEFVNDDDMLIYLRLNGSAIRVVRPNGGTWYSALFTGLVESRCAAPAKAYTIYELIGPGIVGGLEDVPEDWHTVGAGGEPSFENSWTSLGGAYGDVRFRRHEGVVYVVGAVHNGSPDTVFTLPAGYRPDCQLYIPVHSRASAGGHARQIAEVTVLSNGQFAVHAADDSNYDIHVTCSFPLTP